MRKSQVEIGGVYVVKVSGVLVPVRIVRESIYGGWDGKNLKTGRTVRIKTAGKLRREYTPVQKNGPRPALRYDVAFTNVDCACEECGALIDSDAEVYMVRGSETDHFSCCKECARDATESAVSCPNPEELSVGQHVKGVIGTYRGIDFQIGPRMQDGSGVVWRIPIWKTESVGAFYDTCEDHPEGAYEWALAAVMKFIDKRLDRKSFSRKRPSKKG